MNTFAQATFASLESGTPPPAPEQKLIVSLNVPGRLPSWNEILGMEQWQRYQFKQRLAEDFLSELKRTAADCSMKTTSAKNIMWTYAATLECYLQTRREKRRLKLAKKKLEKKSPNLFALKSTGLGKVPF